ncbi:hypothetical protein [Novosphingobium silvae]|uniref:hypothetical protein n=1 Tax=Novosphingobium silvae TaxID=2692619 RepID=UPI001927CDD2|nr:hypothetical protein [Novosphingobium silvae]
MSKLADEQKSRFRTFMLGKAAGTKKTDFAIEDLFPDKFYVDCVNATYALAIKMEDLPEDGSDMVTKRVEHVLKTRYGHKELDKRRVMGEMWKHFDTWSSAADLPKDAVIRAEKLFKAINAAFAEAERP